MESPFFDEFQFHKGTIRTYKGVKQDKMFKDFNSIKVQLELRGRGEGVTLTRISIP